MIKYGCKCLGRNLSHLSEVFSIIQDEEERRNVTLDTLVEEGSILAMVTPSSSKNYGSQTLTPKVAEGRHSDHWSTKMDFGVITTRKLVGNWRENNHLIGLTTTLRNSIYLEAIEQTWPLQKKKQAMILPPSNL